MPGPDFHIYLASASPRRAALLEQIGVRYCQIATDVDEQVRLNESAIDYVKRLALFKAEAARACLQVSDTHPVIGADTAVVVDGQILGKPLNKEDALDMWSKLSGRCHEVYTAVALLGKETQIACNISKVCFKKLNLMEQEAYWATGEPRDKAGSYAVQGLGAIFIERLDGSYSGVMGLPLFETQTLLLGEGIDMLREIKNIKGTSA